MLRIQLSATSMMSVPAFRYKAESHSNPSLMLVVTRASYLLPYLFVVLLLVRFGQIKTIENINVQLSRY